MMAEMGLDDVNSGYCAISHVGLCRILMAPTGIRVRTSYLVTQLCMLFATLIFVNAGSQIPPLHSLSDFISGNTVIVLAGLAASRGREGSR